MGWGYRRRSCLDSLCSVDSLRAFVQQYLDGEVEPYIKSEPVPEDNDGPVKVSVSHDCHTAVMIFPHRL